MTVPALRRPPRLRRRQHSADRSADDGAGNRAGHAAGDSTGRAAVDVSRGVTIRTPELAGRSVRTTWVPPKSPVR